jgi:hypothetical protein
VNAKFQIVVLREWVALSSRTPSLSLCPFPIVVQRDIMKLLLFIANTTGSIDLLTGVAILTLHD